MNHPDLQIIGVTGKFHRTCQDECRNTFESLQEVVGVHRSGGPGMLKIIKGLFGEDHHEK